MTNQFAEWLEQRAEQVRADGLNNSAYVELKHAAAAYRAEHPQPSSAEPDADYMMCPAHLFAVPYDEAGDGLSCGAPTGDGDGSVCGLELIGVFTHPPQDALVEALEESVKLQSHYALLLNMHDGGRRLRFGSAEAWLERLAAIAGRKG